MNEAILKLEKISKSFNEKQVLNSIDLKINKGTILGLIGKNGAGKSTLIKILLGLLKPDRGQVSIAGENSWELNAKTKQRIGYVPQSLTGFRWMRVETMLNYTGSFYANWNEEKANQLLKDWDLDPWSKISSLSEGERQKLAIIQAMGHEPDIFIFDEPVAALDPVTRRDFIKKLIDLNMDESKTMLFSTHITSDLERIAADIALLHNQQIEYHGDLAELKDRIKRLHIHAFKELPAKLPINNILSSRINKTSAVITVDSISENEINSIEEQLNAKITVEYLNLEEIFLELNQ